MRRWYQPTMNLAFQFTYTLFYFDIYPLNSPPPSPLMFNTSKFIDLSLFHIWFTSIYLRESSCCEKIGKKVPKFGSTMQFFIDSSSTPRVRLSFFRKRNDSSVNVMQHRGIVFPVARDPFHLSFSFSTVGRGLDEERNPRCKSVLHRVRITRTWRNTPNIRTRGIA